MANRAGRSYGRLIQRNYRPRYFKVLKAAAWIMLLMIALCVWVAVK